MREIVISDTSKIQPHIQYVENFEKRSYGLYKAGCTISKIDNNFIVLEVPKILVVDDREAKDRYIIVHGQHRACLAHLYKIGIEAGVLKNKEECFELPNDLCEGIQLGDLARNFDYAQDNQTIMQSGGINSFDSLIGYVKKDLLSERMKKLFLKHPNHLFSFIISFIPI